LLAYETLFHAKDHSASREPVNGRTLTQCLAMTDAAVRLVRLPLPITTDGRTGFVYTICGSPVHKRKTTSVRMDRYALGWCGVMKFDAWVRDHLPRCRAGVAGAVKPWPTKQPPARSGPNVRAGIACHGRAGMQSDQALGPYPNLLKTESGRGYRLLGGWTVRRLYAAKPQPVSSACVTANRR
jgi:hypothetical protein